MKRRKPIEFNCDYCGSVAIERPSHFKRKNRHFCCMDCYSAYRRDFMPKEEQNAYKGGGMPDHEKQKRIKARRDLNHAIRDGKLIRRPCESCGEKKTQGHHTDYSKPLKVRWLCIKCHWEEHKIMFKNPELLKK